MPTLIPMSLLPTPDAWEGKRRTHDPALVIGAEPVRASATVTTVTSRLVGRFGALNLHVAIVVRPNVAIVARGDSVLYFIEF